VKHQSWDAAQKTFSIENIERFSHQLQVICWRYPHPPLKEYVQLLSDHLDAFDWEQIPTTVTAFAALFSRAERPESGGAKD
jgi:hypothetical protein